MKYFLLSFLLATAFLLSDSSGQLFDSDVYKINPWVDGAITVGAFATNYWGLRVVDRKKPLDSLEIYSLDPNDINAFDRSATRQDASKMTDAWALSDVGMTGSFFLPVLLMLDKDIRQDWAPVLMLYLQAEGIAGTLWSWGASIHIDRIRPLVYNPDVPMSEKPNVRNKNSFFSGHTSSSAAASFLFAKV